MPGIAAELTAKLSVRQCAETATMALGRSGSKRGKSSRKTRSRTQVSRGVQSMKKQGPPPCGRKNVGILDRDALAVMVLLLVGEQTMIRPTGR
jgi:hypothetical protein